MVTRNLLFKRDYKINDNIKIVIPTVGEVLDNEDEYYSLITMFTAMPIDMMVQLDDIGLDFTEINEYQLFLLLFGVIKEADTSLIFGDLNLSSFEKAINTVNNEIILVDKKTDVRIDRALYGQIASVLRKINHIDRDYRKPANEEAKSYMISRAREKQKRQRNRTVDSQLERLIVALVNTSEFGYGYEGVKDLTIYQFNQSLWQVIHKIDYDNRMHGIYAGTVNAKELSQDDLTWLINK